MKARAIAVALVALLVVALPASASGTAEAGRARRDHLDPQCWEGADLRPVPAGTCQIHFRISTVNSRWASAKVRPDLNGENIVKPLDVGLRRPHRKGGAWEVKSIGNGGGCNVPKRPRHDLDLICLAIGPGQ